MDRLPIGRWMKYELSLPTQKKSKSLAFKTIDERAVSHDSSEEDAVDKDVAYLVKNFRKFLKLKNSGKPDIFEKASPIVERIVKFDTLGTTFIPKIFESRDWADMFRNFEDPIEELVKEFYSNARYTRVELKCWVRGTKFFINSEYIAKVLCITRLACVDTTPYDDRVLKAQDILQVLGTDHEVVSKGTSIGIGQFSPELTTLKLIIFSNLYPLSNIAFINLGRAQFLCDLITGVSIDICVHIFQIIGKAIA
nr:hypothetical protein CFP56_17794 [Quercus suber]